MADPRPRDVQAREVETSTINDLRQYGQSAYGPFYDSQRGHLQGQLHNMEPVLKTGPFEADIWDAFNGEPGGRMEADQEVTAILNPGYAPAPPLRTDLYGDNTAWNDTSGTPDDNY